MEGEWHTVGLEEEEEEEDLEASEMDGRRGCKEGRSAPPSPSNQSHSVYAVHPTGSGEQEYATQQPAQPTHLSPPFLPTTVFEYGTVPAAGRKHLFRPLYFLGEIFL